MYQEFLQSKKEKENNPSKNKPKTWRDTSLHII